MAFLNRITIRQFTINRIYRLTVCLLLSLNRVGSLCPAGHSGLRPASFRAACHSGSALPIPGRDAGGLWASHALVIAFCSSPLLFCGACRITLFKLHDMSQWACLSWLLDPRRGFHGLVQPYCGAIQGENFPTEIESASMFDCIGVFVC